MEEKEEADYTNVSLFAFPASYRRTTQNTYKCRHIQVLQHLTGTSGSRGSSTLRARTVAHCLEFSDYEFVTFI
jgi:hypothetical protein